MTLTKFDLKDAACSVPGCVGGCAHTLYLHARCHPSAGLDVCYSKAAGELEIRCKRCAQLVARIAVADF